MAFVMSVSNFDKKPAKVLESKSKREKTLWQDSKA